VCTVVAVIDEVSSLASVDDVGSLLIGREAHAKVDEPVAVGPVGGRAGEAVGDVDVEQRAVVVEHPRDRVAIDAHRERRAAKQALVRARQRAEVGERLGARIELPEPVVFIDDIDQLRRVGAVIAAVGTAAATAATATATAAAATATAATAAAIAGTAGHHRARQHEHPADALHARDTSKAGVNPVVQMSARTIARLVAQDL
jgi:hypothetical protein